MVTLVDDHDYGYLNQWKWHAVTNERGKIYYATRTARKRDNRNLKRIRMHREILNPPDNTQVDHIDENGLNNQRYNLRVCTNQQNQMNRGPVPNTISKYKGVTWYRPTEKWKAQIKIDSKNYHLGYFHSETDAAMAYDKRAIEVFGNFAYLNFNQ
jgi:hypothetical protein